MSRPEKKRELEAGRRDFLKLAALGAPVAAVASATGATEAEAAEPTQLGYRETPHVKTYYDSCRF